MFHIDEYDFNSNTPLEVSELRHNSNDVGLNWPIVYIINNDEEAYVGETVNASRRIEQHLQNEDRQRLTEIRIISDKNFNKSVILDLESYLIKYMASDGRFVLQNGNGGIRDHEYYERLEYQGEFKQIWQRLKHLGIVDKTIEEIENSELFKYSPYKSLGAEQIDAERRILDIFANYSADEDVTILVRGGAGTGKTILGIYLLKLFADIASEIPLEDLVVEDYLDEDDALSIFASDHIKGIEKIGIVIPQKSLQTSLKDVFGGIKALDPSMVLSPAEVVKDYMKTGKQFDLLIVDEAHRLKCRNKGHLSNYRVFDECNRNLGLDKMEGTELDWLMLCSKHQIIFRDELQTVRPCDIDAGDFTSILNRYRPPVAQLPLDTQWRCEGGKDYTDYIRDIFEGRAVKKREIENYDLKLYTDCAKMVEDIILLNEEMGLCRVAAGYAWPWDRKKPDEYTIEIQGKWYRWNRTYNNWITSRTAAEEIGCIHTVQGYDLNYAGVIIGEDLKYDRLVGEIFADKTCYYDQQGKSGVADNQEALRSYLCNIYRTLLTRGIKGTYIYVCDDGLRDYLSKFFDIA